MTTQRYSAGAVGKQTQSIQRIRGHRYFRAGVASNAPTIQTSSRGVACDAQFMLKVPCQQLQNYGWVQNRENRIYLVALA